MRFKKSRLGPQLFSKAADPDFFDQIHVIFGGSGAVGGATALQLISLLEEVIARSSAAGSERPRIVITARTKQELRQFTSTLFRLQQRDHSTQPTLLNGVGYQTVRGVVVELNTLSIDPHIPEFSDFAMSTTSERDKAIADFLGKRGSDLSSPLANKIQLLKDAIEGGVGSFTSFLQHYAETKQVPNRAKPFRSVVVAIPLASVVSYRLSDFETACRHLGLSSETNVIEELKSDYLRAIRDDLASVADHLAEEVIAAHTTAVGGMYDEESNGTNTIRLGFAHSALDNRLRQKQAFAEKLTSLYAERGIKMLITAAAIGVDSILLHKAPPLNPAVRRQLLVAKTGGKETITAQEKRANELKVYPPVDLDLLSETDEPVAFSHGHPLVLDYMLKSGENGFFTVSNADALYRVMRVTSGAELGLILARVALLGDDLHSPYFVDNKCYYTETDNSRQVFDLLNQPHLRKNQTSGLQVKALQDLGSAKHQGELHTLGLLILLRRLQSLSLENISRHVDLSRFDPKDYFETNSKELTLENILGWEAKSLSGLLTTLVTANSEADLAPLKHLYQDDPQRQEAIHRVLREVLWSTRAVSSIGSPILFECAGRKRVLSGYYLAPIDRIVTHRNTLREFLREEFERVGGGDDERFEKFLEFYAASFGFVDVRPVAVLVTARAADENFADHVQVFRDEPSFRAALERLEPYSYFTTNGLLALLVRLKGLSRVAQSLDFELGSANEFRTHFYHDLRGQALLIPGVVEAFRMVSEGLEKNTGTERLDGRWGYYL